MLFIDGVNITRREYQALKIKALEEQRAWEEAPRIVVICPWCNKPGESMDLHHWCFKRGANVPQEVLHMPINVVLLHPQCHQTHGQTKAMTTRMYAFKSQFYDIEAWLEGLSLKQPIQKVPEQTHENQHRRGLKRDYTQN